jgi:hypothetical protein
MMDYKRLFNSKLLYIAFLFSTLNSLAATLTMGTSGSQSATITATSASPDKFYDNGGSGSNYSSSVTATYTFNCAAGKYIRIKLNSLSTESSADYFFVYDGTTTSDRLIGEQSNSGTISTSYMYVATSGSITVKFTSDGSVVGSGWDADVYVGDYAGQLWDGSTSTEVSTASNWEGDVIPTRYSSIYVPSGLSNYPTVSDASTSQPMYDLRIASGAFFYFTSLTTGHNTSIYGNAIIDGTYNKTSTFFVNFEGGNSGNYATISGSGNMTTMSVGVGLNRLSFYKILNTLTIQSFKIQNTYGTSGFDMNGFNLYVASFTVESSTLFYHRTGSLRVEGATIAIDDASFNENTGTTIFASGNNWVAKNQTIPSVSFYNLQIGTNNGYTVTIGSGTTLTVLNDLTIANANTAGGIATNPNDVTVGGNFNLGTTGNALTLNLANRIYRASGTGTFTMGNVSGHAINNTYASASNYVISGFDAVPTFYGTFTYNSGSAQKVIPASYNHFVSSGSGTKTLFGNIDINGNATLSGGKLAQGTFDINIAGNWTSSGDYFTEGTGTVTFDGTGNSTVSSTSAIIGGSTGTSLLTESFENSGSIPSGWGTTLVTNVTTAPALTYVSSSSNPTVSAASAGTYFAKFNSYSATSGNQIRLRRTSGFSTTNYSNIVVNFDWYRDNGYSASNDYVTVQYSTDGSVWTSVGSNVTRYSVSNGWTTQSVTLPVGAENQASLQIAFLFTSQFGNNCSLDNVSVTGDMAGTAYSGEVFNKLATNKSGSAFTTLASNITAQTSLTLTSGLIKTVSYTLTLGSSSANATISGGSSSSYVVAYDNSGVIGNVKHYVNSLTSYSFPVGDANYYTPLSLTLSSATLTNSSITTYTKPVKVPGLNPSLTNYINRFWEVSPSGISSPTYSISYTYDNADINGSETTFEPVKLSSGTWYKPTGCTFLTGTEQGSSSFNPGSNILTWNSLTTFSSFGAAGDQAVPLPIELVYFQAKSEQNDVKLNWETAAEINNDYFTIERSFDGTHFTPITRIDGAGNSTHKIDYLTIDKDYINGINYYRLIQTDYNGEETTSKIVSVDMTKKNTQFMQTVNSIGQEVDKNYSGIVFDVYSDGSTVKRIQ